MQVAQERALAGELALARADRRVEDRARGQADQDHDPGDREAAAGLLVGVLGVGGLVLGRVGHGDRRAIDEGDRTAVEQPGLGRGLSEPIGGVADEPGQERLGEA